MRNKFLLFTALLCEVGQDMQVLMGTIERLAEIPNTPPLDFRSLSNWLTNQFNYNFLDQFEHISTPFIIETQNQ